MDLTSLPQELLLARGEYATVRSAHEDAKKQMQMMCGALGAGAAQVLRSVQPADDSEPDLATVRDLIDNCRNIMAAMDACADTIFTLSQQRTELKPRAWPKGGK